MVIASGDTEGHRFVQRTLMRCWNVSNGSCAYRYVEVLEISDLEAGVSDDIDCDMVAVYVLENNNNGFLGSIQY